MAAHLHWRIYVTNSGGYVGIYSLDFQDASGTSLCVGGTPYASSEYAFYHADRAFPGGAANWIANSEGAGAWLGYTFAAPVDVKKVLMAGYGPCGDTLAHLNTAQLQSSDNGADWAVEWETDQPGGGWVSAVAVEYDAPVLLPQDVSKLGLYVVEGGIPIPQSVSKAGEYVVEGPPHLPQEASKLGLYVVEGGRFTLYGSKLGLYVIEGPPPPVPPASDHYGQMMVG